MSQYQAAVIRKPAAACVGRSLGEEPKCIKPGTSADRSPRVLVRSSQLVALMHEAQQQFSVWREVASLGIDSALKPSAMLKTIVESIPSDQMEPCRRPPAKDHGLVRIFGENDEKGRLNGLA